MIYPVVRELAVDQIPVAVTCRVLRLAPSGYYDWVGRPLTGRDLEDAYLLNEIVDIHRASRGTYGAPRVHAELKLGKGIGCGRKRVERLMREAGLRGVTRRRLRGLTKRDRDALPSDDLVNRCFTVDAPDRLWTADITEHPTAEGKVYAAVVVDAFSRRVIGLSIADHLRAEIVVDALQMAIWRRAGKVEGTIHHSDHGCQYTSWAFGQRLRAAGSWARWAASGMPSTTPSPRRSSRPCRPSCSTGAAGTPAASWPTRSSSTSSASTTRAGVLRGSWSCCATLCRSDTRSVLQHIS